MRNVTSCCVALTTTLRAAAERINETARGIVLVVDSEQRLLGTVSDGDIRRAMLDGLAMTTTVGEVLGRKSGSAYPQPVTAMVGTSHAELVRLIRTRGVRQVPVVDEHGRVHDLVTWTDLVPDEVLPLQAVIMAGGQGSRLRPLTDKTPKPMLPVGEKPLMEHIVEQLRGAGVQRVNVTTHYKSERITEHFGNGERFGVSIEYIAEPTPLGTAGALSLLGGVDEPILVINGDILTTVDFRAMLDFHKEQAAELTVAVREYDIRVPYGVLDCSGPLVVGVHEKPMLSLNVAAGIYLMEPEVLALIEVGEHVDMPELVERLLAEQRVVSSFPIVEYWLDIGHEEDYRQAQEDLKNGRLRPSGVTGPEGNKE